jgi:hypothetical protein
MDKENVVYIHGGVLSATKKEEIILFTGKWMKLKSIMLKEISQTQKQVSHVFSHI